MIFELLASFFNGSGFWTIVCEFTMSAETLADLAQVITWSSIMGFGCNKEDENCQCDETIAFWSVEFAKKFPNWFPLFSWQCVEVDKADKRDLSALLLFCLWQAFGAGFFGDLLVRSYKMLKMNLNQRAMILSPPWLFYWLYRFSQLTGMILAFIFLPCNLFTIPAYNWCRKLCDEKHKETQVECLSSMTDISANEKAKKQDEKQAGLGMKWVVMSKNVLCEDVVSLVSVACCTALYKEEDDLLLIKTVFSILAAAARLCYAHGWCKKDRSEDIEQKAEEVEEGVNEATV